MTVLAYTAAWKRRAERWKAAAKDKRRIGLAVAQRAEEWSRRGQMALDRAEALAAENRRLREALAVYADVRNWDEPYGWMWMPDTPGPDVARKALGEAEN